MVLRNELGRQGGSDGSVAEVVERGGEIGLVLFLFLLYLADGVLADDFTKPLQFGKSFVEGAFGGGAVAESEREESRVELVVIEGVQFERKGTVHTPLAERHLRKKHPLSFGLGFPFVIEFGANGVELFKIGSGEAFGAEVVLDSIAGRDGFAGLRARAGGGVGNLGGFDSLSLGIGAGHSFERKVADEKRPGSCRNQEMIKNKDKSGWKIFEQRRLDS
jgi:hypothetical protein